MKEVNCTLSEFVEMISDKRMGYMKKPRGRLTVGLWWEEKEKENYHFMNISEKKSGETNYPPSIWVVKKNLLNHLEVYVKEGYKLYI